MCATARGGGVRCASGEMNAASRRAARQHTQAVLSYAAASAGVTLRRWHLLATDVLTDRANALILTSRGCRPRHADVLELKSGKLSSLQNSPPEASIAPLNDMRTLAQKTRRVRGMLRSCLSARLFIEPGTTLAVERRSTG